MRDEDSGEVWSPTALPIREEGASYVARHGQGYSRFEHVSHGIALELLQYVPVDDPIKISRLKITNHSGRARRLSVTAYVEWVLGASRGAAAPFIVTEIDAETGAMFARNPWNNEFGERVAFADLARPADVMDRRPDGIPRPQRHARSAGRACRAARRSPTASAPASIPAARCRPGWSSRPNGTTEIVFFLGEAATQAEAQSLLDKIPHRRSRRGPRRGHRVSGTTTLGTVQVKTPDRAMDILLNRWLLYQTLACRVWARSAFYQASGAYGFRDQLQDVMALCVSRPDMAREHLLRAAARQFVEGDVQHWWLPESGRGVRTRVSDDRVWLPYVVAHYVEVTGDLARPGRDGAVPRRAGAAARASTTRSSSPTMSDEQATLFEHCALALDQSLAVGSHGLPLIGTGDWNDGMNRVGEQGKGESVWLGWFLYAALTAFARLADSRDEPDARGELAATCRGSGGSARARRLGRRLVSPRLFRRRHAARLGRERANAASIRSRSPGA